MNHCGNFLLNAEIFEILMSNTFFSWISILKKLVKKLTQKRGHSNTCKEVAVDTIRPTPPDTPGTAVFSQGLYVEFHTKGIFDMELEV